MSEALIERLRASQEAHTLPDGGDWRILGEAANLIEAIEREVKELREKPENCGVEIAHLRAQLDSVEDGSLIRDTIARAEAAEDTVARLSEALRKAGVSFETIRLTLIKNLEEPERAAFWEAVHARDATRAALSGSGPGWPVPDGWKLVPVEPDDAMIEAGQDTCEEKNSWGGRVYASDIWESMLAASPAAPQQGGE